MRIASCHGKVGASCFWRGDEAPEYVAVSVDDEDYDDEYYGEVSTASGAWAPVLRLAGSG